MTLKELNAMTFDISEKVQHFKTFAKLFQLSVMECPNLAKQQKRLPPLDDISALAFMLADQAAEATDNMIMELPRTIEGITP